MTRRLYEHGETLILPNGKILEFDSIDDEGPYGILKKVPVVVNVDSDGVMSSFTRLAVLKDRFGITEEDPERAWQMVIEAEEAEARRIEEEAKEQAPALEAMMDEIAAIKAELSGLSSALSTGTQENGNMADSSM